MQVHLNKCMFDCVYIMYVYDVYVCVYTWLCIYIYIYIYIYMYIMCVCVYLYKCIYFLSSHLVTCV